MAGGIFFNNVAQSSLFYNGAEQRECFYNNTSVWRKDYTLYNGGNVGVSGGWSVANVVDGVSCGNGGNHLAISSNSGSYDRSGWWRTNNLIDLTNIRTITLSFSCSNMGVGEIQLFATRMYGNEANYAGECQNLFKGGTFDANTIAKTRQVGGSGAYTLTLDVSGATGNWYIGFGHCSRSNLNVSAWCGMTSCIAS